jgi:hypothetical protein
MQVYVESSSDYQCPDPIRSYKIKIRVISRIKGQPVNYNESLSTAKDRRSFDLHRDYQIFSLRPLM